MLAKHKAADKVLEKIREAGDTRLDLNIISNKTILQCCEK